MRKFLVIFSALGLTSTMISSVIACGSNPHQPVVEGKESQTVKDIRAESLQQVQGYVLADAYGLDLTKTTTTLNNYYVDKNYFNANTLSQANLIDVQVNGVKGSDGELLTQLVEMILNQGDSQTSPILAFLDKYKALIASLPGGLNTFPLEQYLASLPTIINLIGQQNLLIDPATSADSIATTLTTWYESQQLDNGLTNFNQATDLSELADLTVAELQSSFLVSLTSLIGYAMYPDSFTSLITPTTLPDNTTVNTYNPQALMSDNYDQAMQNFFSFVFKKGVGITPPSGYAVQSGGMLFYLGKTLKILEVLLSLYDECLNDDFVIVDGTHLFSTTITNVDYLAIIKTKKVSDQAISEKGLHLEYLLSKLGYFFNDKNEEENGYRILKLLNIFLASGGYEFSYLKQTILDLVNAYNPTIGAILALNPDLFNPLFQNFVTYLLVPLFNNTPATPSKILSDDLKELLKPFLSLLPDNWRNLIKWLDTTAAQNFLNEPWTQLYQGNWNDLVALFGANLDPLNFLFGVDHLNFHLIFNQLLVRNLMLVFFSSNLDLGRLSDLTFDGMISRIVSDLAIQNENISDQIGNIIPVDNIQTMMKLLFEKNFITDTTTSSDQSVVHQVVSHLNDLPEILPFLGYDLSQSEPYVYSQSLLGQLVYCFSPTLKANSTPSANDGKGELLNLNTLRSADPANHWALSSGIGRILGDLLNGTDYRDFVLNQVLNASWVVEKVISNYDPSNPEVLLNQTYNLIYTGNDYNLGAIAIKAINAQYQITFARVNANEKFSFKKLVRLV
ncbi:hypothetical protein [Mesoplasma whartonense]|uniref:hypothetical protein n=1 Tax=Mesoplasma whartonense TaxID=2878854 RepID=UPI002022B476|nr:MULTISPECIES: hypothetical protein [unclassified Mesoplasma]MCL8212532.1 hypothetical protein [Mesoplasma sp. JKS002661]MCL8215954.1 hypothetical protein [Mesoplasma sp. JKS002657]